MKKQEKALAKQEEEDRRKLLATASAGNDVKKSAVSIEGNDQRNKQMASPVSGSDAFQLEKSSELPANVNLEQIAENKRTITRATVTKNNKEIIYLKIIYKWGGVFYFENGRSISQSTFQLATNVK